MGLSVALAALARADVLAVEVQQRVRAATFEVVQRKPEADPLTYEKPLPLDLIPFQERSDKYRSIGTAFAIDGHRYVTAAHVLGLGLGSQYGAPEVRDAAGHVFAIAQVLKYSQSQDFAVFTLKDAPRVAELAGGPKPALNEPVYAVGNALGEGIVIRDGVFTSETPEEEAGRWQWLRFTAAASPGNSGGPLVDQHGRVIGIVLRKSESENLNYAAPFALIDAASPTSGDIGSRTSFRLPIMDTSEIVDNRTNVQLPTTLADLYAAMNHALITLFTTGDRQIMEHNAERLFPMGPGSEQLLDQVSRSPLPRAIHQSTQGRWAVAAPQTKSMQLEENGLVVSAGEGLRLKAPDGLALATLYGDSKLYMDLLLKSSLPLHRKVGSDSVKVVSLGKALEQSDYTDNFGRLWRVMVWSLPFDDSMLVTLNMPTPEGYAALIAAGRTMTKAVMIGQQELAANYQFVTLEGTLARWREFQSLSGVQPRALAGLHLTIEPDTKLQLHSKRFELEVTPQLQALRPDTVLAVNFSYFHDGTAVVWDVGGIELLDPKAKGNWIQVRRVPAPSAALPDAFQNTWQKLGTAAFPFNGDHITNNGMTRVNAAATVSGVAASDVKVRYGLAVSADGTPSDHSLETRLALLQTNFKALEH
ncbi:MAG TPA: serine protease [Steroidobacteraceae bacterium]